MTICIKCNEEKEEKQMYSKTLCWKCQKREQYQRVFGKPEDRAKFREVRKTLRQVK